jgi:hypothetical protein
MNYNVTLMARARNHRYRGKEISITSKVPSMQSAFYRNLWPVRLYFILPHYLVNGKKVLQHKMCVLIFSTSFV